MREGARWGAGDKEGVEVIVVAAAGVRARGVRDISRARKDGRPVGFEVESLALRSVIVVVTVCVCVCRSAKRSKMWTTGDIY